MATGAPTEEPISSTSSKHPVRTGAMLVKALVLLMIAVAGVMAYRFTALREWLQPAGQAADWVRRTGFWGAAGFLVGRIAIHHLVKRFKPGNRL